jgi:hypothetical protein
MSSKQNAVNGGKIKVCSALGAEKVFCQMNLHVFRFIASRTIGAIMSRIVFIIVQTVLSIEYKGGVLCFLARHGVLISTPYSLL